MDASGSRKSDLGPVWTPLGREIAARIEARGPLTFAEFMEAALYHPELGYYAAERERWGPRGDYLTTPQVHPAVGRAIAALAGELDAALGAPDPFTLVEYGCGDGRLLATVADAIQHGLPPLFGRLRIVGIERGRASLARLPTVVPEPPRGIHLASAVGDGAVPDTWAGLVFSNELLDAFPVERLRERAGELWQSRIDRVEGGLVERFDLPPDPAVRLHLRDNGIALREQQEAEICLAVAPWLAGIAARLSAGALLTIDYGHETATLYGPARPRGTLVCQRRFELDDAPLADVGLKDMTAHVDFGNLRRIGRRHGFEGGELASLRVFLLGMGAAAGDACGWGDRLALRHLLVSEVGDRHRVLLQTRGVTQRTLPFGRERLFGDGIGGPGGSC